MGGFSGMDREKVIAWLADEELYYREHGDAHNSLMACDALALLKEQDADKPKGHWMPYEPDKRGYTDGFTCSRCERVILSDHYCKMIDFDFCPYCGAYMDNAEGR
jgi:hypothetical protein